MKAKDVNPSNFKVENVVFENDDFSIGSCILQNYCVILYSIIEISKQL